MLFLRDKHGERTVWRAISTGSNEMRPIYRQIENNKNRYVDTNRSRRVFVFFFFVVSSNVQLIREKRLRDNIPYTEPYKYAVQSRDVVGVRHV